MSDGNAGQRKMMRGMSPGGGTPFHDSLPRSTHTTTPTAKRADRVAKKQIKTRENRAARREQN